MRRLFLFATLLMITFVGCTKEPDVVRTETHATSETIATSASTSAPAPGMTNTSAPASTATPSAAVTPPGTVIASTDGETAGTKIDITELKRTSGGTVTLKFVLTNSSDKKLVLSGHWLGDASKRDDYYGVGGIHLIDQANKKKYFVVRDSDQKCLCSMNVEPIEPGQKTTLWAKYPAPPPEVQKISVVIPHFLPLEDVPIQ